MQALLQGTAPGLVPALWLVIFTPYMNLPELWPRLSHVFGAVLAHRSSRCHSGGSCPEPVPAVGDLLWAC